MAAKIKKIKKQTSISTNNPYKQTVHEPHIYITNKETKFNQETDSEFPNSTIIVALDIDTKDIDDSSSTT